MFVFRIQQKQRSIIQQSSIIKEGMSFLGRGAGGGGMVVLPVGQNMFREGCYSLKVNGLTCSLPIFCIFNAASLFVIIIIMEICKAPTLRLKALNKHTHIMYIEMENVIQKQNKIIYR